MGLFDIFKSKSAAEPQPEKQEEKQKELNEGLEKTKQGLFSKLTRAIAGRSTVDADVLDDKKKK